MKRVLHFDINGTIIPNDTTETGTDEENANMIIAKNVYGTVSVSNNWYLRASNIYDSTNGITYYDYLKKHYNDYKQRSFIFTHHGNPGQTLCMMVNPIMNAMKTFLFPSFLKVLEKHQDVTIVFRTFGLDADEVIHYLRTNEKTSGMFSSVIKGKFTYPGGETRLTLEDGTVIVGMDKVNELIKSAPKGQHFAFIENYNHWNDHNRDKKYGKLLLGDKDMLQIFFDDNPCVNMSGENVRFIWVNTLNVLFDDDYYMKLIDKII